MEAIIKFIRFINSDPKNFITLFWIWIGIYYWIKAFRKRGEK